MKTIFKTEVQREPEAEFESFLMFDENSKFKKDEEKKRKFDDFANFEILQIAKCDRLLIGL